jgi:hypothetical protein
VAASTIDGHGLAVDWQAFDGTTARRLAAPEVAASPYLVGTVWSTAPSRVVVYLTADGQSPFSQPDQPSDADCPQ